MRRRDAGLPVVGRLRPVLAGEHDRLHGRDAGLLHAVGHLRPLHRRRRLRRRDARLRLAVHTCRACSGDAECGGATPACESSGACGQCSANNSTQCTGATPLCETGAGKCVRCLANADCSGTTPVCDGGTHTCRGCGGDGDCGGATPACQASGACGICSATNTSKCTGATPACDVPTGTCVNCMSNAECGGNRPVCNTATHTCRALRDRHRVWRRNPACQASGACGQCSADQHGRSARAPRRSATRRRGAASPASRTPTAAARRRPSATATCTAAAAAAATASAAARRPRARRRAVRAVLGQQRGGLHRRDALLQHGERKLRLLREQQPVQRRDADLRRRHARVSVPARATATAAARRRPASRQGRAASARRRTSARAVAPRRLATSRPERASAARRTRSVGAPRQSATPTTHACRACSGDGECGVEHRMSRSTASAIDSGSSSSTG